jgi:hypothetical protein
MGFNPAVHYLFETRGNGCHSIWARQYQITGYCFAQKIIYNEDIIIPGVENVFVAAVQEWSDDFMEKVWYAYLVNDSDF